MLNLFIDTNVYLTFYSFTTDDLEELEKLSVAVKNGDVRLWITDQVFDEFARNRETKLAESMAGLRKMKLPDGFPQVVRNYKEFGALQDGKRAFGEQLNSIKERLTKEAADRTLAADQRLGELMASAERITVTDRLLQTARRRVDVGNPPGKKGDLGDAINWEALLAEGPDDEDLHFVSGDSDYASKLDPDALAQFLRDEWTQRKGGDVQLHRSLSAFFLDNYPDIKLATELEQELRVRRLVESTSFDDTHRAIAALPAPSDLSDQHARALLEAAVVNSQIRWIALDPDVRGFFRELFEANPDILTDYDLVRFREIYGI